MDIKKHTKRATILGIIALLGVMTWVMADEIVRVIEIVQVVPPGNCQETDGGLVFNQSGCITGTFNTSAGLLENVTFCDGCLSNFTLIEYACGSNVPPGYPELAGAFEVNCTNGCSNGRCL